MPNSHEMQNAIKSPSETVQNILDWLQNEDLTQLNVQQCFSNTEKTLKESLKKTIEDVQKNNDSSDDKYLNTLQELKKDPTQRKKARKIKVDMEKQKINQNFENITDEKYGEITANTLRINEINNLVAFTDGEDLRAMKDELSTELNISTKDIDLIAQVQDLMIDGSLKLNQEEAFFIAFNTYKIQGELVKYGTDKEWKYCAFPTEELQKASAKYWIGKTGEKPTTEYIGRYKYPTKNTVTRNVDGLKQTYKSVIEQANPLIEKAWKIKEYLINKMCKEKGIIQNETFENIQNGKRGETWHETNTLWNGTRSNGINGIDGYGLFHGNINLETPEQNTKVLEIDEEEWGNMIIDVQWIDKDGGTFTLFDPDTHQELGKIVCDKNGWNGESGIFKDIPQGILITKISNTCIKIDFSFESPIKKFELKQEANEGKTKHGWEETTDREEIFVRVTYEKIHEPTIVTPHPEKFNGWENKDLWARGLTDQLINQVRNIKDSKPEWTFFSVLNLKASVDTTRINPTSRKYKEWGECYEYVKSFLDDPNISAQEKAIIEGIRQEVKDAFATHIEANPNDQFNHPYAKDEAAQQGILAAWRAVTLLKYLKEEWLLNNATEIRKQARVQPDGRWVSFDGNINK